MSMLIPSVWTTARCKRLTELWNTVPEIGTAQIAKLMGMSKNAVVGKAHRLGLSKRKNPIMHLSEEELRARIKSGMKKHFADKRAREQESKPTDPPPRPVIMPLVKERLPHTFSARWEYMSASVNWAAHNLDIAMVGHRTGTPAPSGQRV